MDLRLPPLSLGGSLLLNDGAAAVPAIERVQNGEFASGAFWDTGGGWTIAAGNATNSGAAGARLTNTLIAPTSAGQSFIVSVVAVANPAGTTWGAVLYNSVTTASQNVMVVVDTSTGTKTAMGTVTGEFDELYIQAVDDPGLVVDDVSFVS